MAEYGDNKHYDYEHYDSIIHITIIKQRHVVAHARLHD